MRRTSSPDTKSLTKIQLTVVTRMPACLNCRPGSSIPLQHTHKRHRKPSKVPPGVSTPNHISQPPPPFPPTGTCSTAPLVLPHRLNIRLHPHALLLRHVPERIHLRRQVRILVVLLYPDVPLRLPAHLPRNHQTLAARALRLYARLPLHRVRVLELVREAVVAIRVAALLGDLDLARDEDGGEGLLDDGPEDGHGGTHDGEVDLEAGEDDGDGRPPREVDVGLGGGAVFDNRVHAPDGSEDDAGNDEHETR